MGPWATVGAGSVVMQQDVPAGATVMGVPAKIVLTLKAKLNMPRAESLPDVVRRELERRAG